MVDIQRLELLCKQMYESQDNAQRSEAETALVLFQESPDALAQCQLLLDRGESSYSQLLAATTLTKLISKNVTGLTLQQRIDIRNYVLTYLATRPNLQNFVIQALVSLLAKMTRYGWLDAIKEEYIFRNIVEDVRKFLQGSVEHCIIAVQILSQLTCEMNQIAEADVNFTFSKHRKIACSFRDTQLYEIFLLSCSLLSTARDNSKNLNFLENSQHELMTQVLRLARNCLSFDFIGTSIDESTDDMTTVQIPTNWRPAFLDFSTVELFFDLYHILPARLSNLALSCLCQITSVRRSLFNNAQRAEFLRHLMNGIKTILENSQGLSDPDNYHEFCRLLARLKTNYQLGELITIQSYAVTMQLIAKFTVQSLQMWQFAPNSVYYLLSLWQRMVISIPYVKINEPHLLGTFTPEITKAFVTSKLESVRVIVRDGLEDPLDDLGTVQQQLEHLSFIQRCEYEKTFTLLINLFDQTAQSYQDLLNRMPQNSMEITIHEGQLTWLVYIIGSGIGGRVTFTADDDHDILDGELLVRVIQLINLTDSRLRQYGREVGCEKLELAVISFFDQVRKVYIVDQMLKNKVYKRLSEVLEINDEPMLLSKINEKIITNLQFWGRSEVIIRKTLDLLNELSLSYSCVRKLIKLKEIQFVLNNHTKEHFSFLGTDIAVSEMRCRSVFYTSLGRLLMVDLGDDEERFYNFMLPLTKQFESIQLINAQGYPSDDARKLLIGLSRDLRGLVFSTGTKTSYNFFFDWIYPEYTSILIQAVELWAHDPAVTTPVLKLFAELVQNRSQRLVFDWSSPNGILLFREASKVICTYGTSLIGSLDVTIPDDQIYSMRLKGISVCFVILRAALVGHFVNFGVFKLYGDSTLDNVLKTTTKLILSIPHDSLLQYPKLSQSYFLLVECLATDHIPFLSTLEPNFFFYMLQSISEGISALGSTNSSYLTDESSKLTIRSPILHATICTGCCSALDNIVSYIFKQLAQKVSTFPSKSNRHHPPPENDMILKVAEMHPEIFKNLLSTLLNIIMFEDCKNQWSMSRPLLCLILLYEDYYHTLKVAIIQSQPMHRKPLMMQWFDNLMDGIERNLSQKNRDRFTQNLSLFRRDVNDSLKAANFNTNSSINDMMVA